MFAHFLNDGAAVVEIQDRRGKKEE